MLTYWMGSNSFIIFDRIRHSQTFWYSFSSAFSLLSQNCGFVLQLSYDFLCQSFCFHWLSSCSTSFSLENSTFSKCYYKQSNCNWLLTGVPTGGVLVWAMEWGFKVERASLEVETSLWRRAITRQAASCWYKAWLAK